MSVKDYIMTPTIGEVTKEDINKKVFLFGIVNRLEEKRTSTNKAYVEFILTDKTGEIVVKVWDTELKGTDIKNADFVKVGGSINVWEERPQLKAEKVNDKLLLRQVLPADEVSIDDYVRTAPHEGEVMFNEILNIVNAFKHQELKNIATETLNTYKDKLLYYPGAKTVHHAYRTGLLYHIYSMILSAMSMRHYTKINMDLLITGIIIHDIGKLVELNASQMGQVEDYTKTGQLLGHIIDGIRMMERIFIKLDVSEEISTNLHHMIASHHYEQKFGAYQMPKFLEAEMLHLLDTMDSRINMIEEATSNVQEGEFGVPAFFLEKRSMYVPNMKEQEKTDEKPEVENIPEQESKTA